MATEFQRGVLEVLNHVRTWNMTHFATVAAFLHFTQDKLSFAGAVAVLRLEWRFSWPLFFFFFGVLMF